MGKQQPSREPDAPVCPLRGKTEDDVKRFLVATIEEHIAHRAETLREIERLSNVFADVADASISRHLLNCPFQSVLRELSERVVAGEARRNGAKQALEKVERRQVRRASTRADTVKLVVQIVVAVLATLGFTMAAMGQISWRTRGHVIETPAVVVEQHEHVVPPAAPVIILEESGE